MLAPDFGPTWWPWYDGMSLTEVCSALGEKKEANHGLNTREINF